MTVLSNQLPVKKKVLPVYLDSTMFLKSFLFLSEEMSVHSEKEKEQETQVGCGADEDLRELVMDQLTKTTSLLIGYNSISQLDPKIIH